MLFAIFLLPAISGYNPSSRRYVDIYTNHPDADAVLKSYDELNFEGLIPSGRRPTQGYLYGHFAHRPRFHTQVGNQTHIQKIPRLDTMKRYLEKLYAEKYQHNEEKFLETPLESLKNKTVSFANKFLSLFTIVQFPNSKCEASGTDGDYEGTCFHASECDAKNGTAMGDCASGFGVCCVFRFTCGDGSNQNCTYFESPNYPNYYPNGSAVLPPGGNTSGGVPDPRLRRLRASRQFSSGALSCAISVDKASDDIQQMRIDFIDLELRSPTNGTCDEERLTITGQDSNSQIPTICGYNTGQHVYVDVSTSSGPVRLSVVSTTNDRKRFKIRICQFSSSCSLGCLQYFTGAQGVISSFNYDQAASFSRSLPGYLNNLNYAVCIRREEGYCTVTYNNIQGGTEYPFQLRNVNMGQPTVPAAEAGADVFNCPDDYVVINGMRLCGGKFNDGAITDDSTMNAPVTDNSAGPIVVRFRTNGDTTGRGFKLFYTENRCRIA